VPDVVILTLRDSRGRPGESCVCGSGDRCTDDEKPRVPVLACADALRGSGASVEFVTASDESEIDTAIKSLESTGARLVVAAATDAELRAVVRRLVRRHSPPPSKRPAEMPAGRTVFDLPPLAVLPLHPGVPDLVARLGLPSTAADVARATLAGRERRLDLLRTDSGSVTLNGALLGGIDPDQGLAPWRGRVEVDDVLLTEGSEAVLACAVRNAGSSDVDGLPLVVDADPADGQVEVAVAVPVLKRRLIRETEVRYEVRRARGRAVTVIPRDVDIRQDDDGVISALGRKRAWWIEAGAWGTYVM
jgi:hypothetical protein